MRFIKSIHKKVRSNYWFINRVPIGVLSVAGLVVFFIMDLALKVIETITN